MLLGHEGLGLCQLDPGIAGGVPHGHALFKHAGADAHEGQAVPVGGVHVGLDLEDEAGELLVRGLDGADTLRHARGGRLGVAQKAVQERLDAEVVGGGAEEHGGQLPGKDLVHVELVPGHVQELDVLHELVVVGLADLLRALGVVDGDGLHVHLSLAVVAAGVQLDQPGVAVVHALEVAVDTDGPVHGAGAYAQHRFDVLHQLKGVPARAVHLVDEREDGNGPQAAHLEQLDGLLLHAFGVVDQHDRAVRRHEGSIGVLGEVLMAGGVQNIDTESKARILRIRGFALWAKLVLTNQGFVKTTFIVKLHRRGRHRDAALLLDLHPVGGGVTRGLAGLHGARLPDRAAVQQQLFGQGRLAGVGVGYDGKGAPARHLGLQFRMRHVLFPPINSVYPR